MIKFGAPVAMIDRIEHLGIAVHDRQRSEELFKRLLGREAYKEEAVEREGVRTVFFQVGESKLELLESTNDESPIARYLTKNREGIHHIALAVTDLEAEIQRLKLEGFEFISDEPKPGADGKMIVFIHPRSANGILVELCADMDPKHPNTSSTK